ncbi:DUF2262 domain-containing protein [Sphingomonas sp.]|uniref:DUF2262 domain-containing protein n=1 Tax=Sphingomonas sp. TaxID=28214 RepID=UPI001B2D56EC|nr:DUF2262 domain-containing protein [Sphingomonas sp.]MBO9713760.1 DUF2262 domain-containing protein [Sphingomonas sp.]
MSSTPPERVRVRGLLKRGGTGLVQSRRDDGRWDVPEIVQHLRPWRRSGGPIEATELYVFKPTRLPHGFWSWLFGLAPAVELIVEIDPARPDRGRIVRYLGPRRDPALAEARGEWLAGRKLEDARFGRFAFDERVNQFEAGTEWLGKPVTLSLEAVDGQAPALAEARALFDAAEAWDKRIRQAMLDSLLALRNETWRDEDEPELDAQAFLDRVTLEAITIGSERFVEFHHDDGDLFAGHTIIVTYDGETDTIDAQIAG